LESKVKTSKKIAINTPAIEVAVDAYKDQSLLVCGFGDIDNFRNRTNTLLCTTLRVVPVAECGATVVPNTICAKNVDGKNVCGGNSMKFLKLCIDLKRIIFR
jgi:hypothetical protein